MCRSRSTSAFIELLSVDCRVLHRVKRMLPVPSPHPEDVGIMHSSDRWCYCGDSEALLYLYNLVLFQLNYLLIEFIPFKVVIDSRTIHELQISPFLSQFFHPNHLFFPNTYFLRPLNAIQ